MVVSTLLLLVFFLPSGELMVVSSVVQDYHRLGSGMGRRQRDTHSMTEI